MYRISVLFPACQGCTAYDVVVSPVFMEKMKISELFRTFFLTVMMEGLERKYEIELSRGKMGYCGYVGNGKWLGKNIVGSTGKRNSA